MGKSRRSIGRRKRLGWLLALSLLLVPAPAMAGVEWTEAATPPDSEGVEWTEGSTVDTEGLDWTEDLRSDTDGIQRPGSRRLRGIEWT